jgi:hypothetical protein
VNDGATLAGLRILIVEDEFLLDAVMGRSRSVSVGRLSLKVMM